MRVHQSRACQLFLVSVVLLAYGGESTFAQSEGMGAHVHGTHPECPLPKTPQDVVNCAREEHLDVKRAKLGLEPLDALEEVARQVPNPEYQTLTVYGRSLGASTLQSENGLLFPIEWGGKRGARIKEAQAQKKQIGAEISQIQ